MDRRWSLREGDAQLKVDQGITAARTIFGKCFFDSKKCAHGIQPLWCITKAGVKQPPTHRTVTRHADEPRLEIGDKIPIEEGVVGVVLARYTRSVTPGATFIIFVELRPDAEDH